MESRHLKTKQKHLKYKDYKFLFQSNRRVAFLISPHNPQANSETMQDNRQVVF